MLDAIYVVLVRRPWRVFYRRCGIYIIAGYELHVLLLVCFSEWLFVLNSDWLCAIRTSEQLLGDRCLDNTYRKIMDTLRLDDEEEPLDFPEWLADCKLVDHLDLKFQAFIVIMGGEDRPLQWE